MNRLNLRSILAAILFLATYLTASAQITTSSLSGKVTDEQKEALAGAIVIAVHTPSGSQYYATVNGEGYYTIHGMRPGGPYELTFSFLGSETKVFKDIIIHLGETFIQDAILKAIDNELDAVVVTASAFKTEKTGPVTNVSNYEIMNTPNIDRSIQELTKLSPYANGMSFAGSDGRSTNFTVDGSNFNNNFGLDDKLPGNSPISLDAIEEIQFVVAPFDVRESNFVGGGINAITKSGTNTFKASAYAYYNNNSLTGHKVGDIEINNATSHHYDVGVTVGGPIIKNKLFFFANFEMSEDREQTIIYQPDEASAATLAKIQQKLINDYGYDPGSFTDYPGGSQNIKILARLDWNINTQHKFSFRFNRTTNKLWNAPNGNSADDNFRNRSSYRSSPTSFPFSNNMYSTNQNVMSFAAELNSRVNDWFSNRFLASYTDNNNMRGSNSGDFPHIDIMNGVLNSKGYYENFTSAGYELFSHNTGGINRIVDLSDDLTFYVGRHTITGGLKYEYQYAYNSYMRNGCGYYRFASAEDFLNGNLPISAAVTYGYNGNDTPGGTLQFHQIAEYIQDEWAIGNRLKLQYGIRADMIIYNENDLTTNNAILALDYGGKHIDTGLWPNTQLQFSPRLGFNWDVLGDKNLTIRGGTGLFQGRLPLVFFTNMPLNAGMIQNPVAKGDYSAKIVKDENNKDQLVYTDAQKKNLTLLNGGKETGGKVITDVKQMVDVLGLPTEISPKEGNVTKGSGVLGIDHNFKMPQTWKSSLAVDYKFPTSFPFSMTAEAIFNKSIYGVCLMNWNINEEAVSNTFTGPDQRINYKQNNYLYNDGYDAYVLSNSYNGWGYITNLTLNMEPVKNLNIMASYTHTDNREISGMPGTNASSAYASLPSVNGPNFQTLQSSIFVVPDKIMLNVGYFIPWKIFCGQGLHINAFYSTYQGSNNSYIYSNDMNGDGIGCDLMYIPNTKDELLFKSEQDRDAFWTFLNNDPYLSKHKGQYAVAYDAHSPFVHKLDLRIAEDFAFTAGDTRHNFQVSISFENLLNMFCSSLGVTRLSCYQSEPGLITPLKYEGTNTEGTPIYSMVQVNNAYPVENYTSYYQNLNETWKILFGIKYIFN